jgi:uncharacterized protein
MECRCRPKTCSVPDQKSPLSEGVTRLSVSSLTQDRIVNVDALRGFALLGILLVNIMAFSSAFYGAEIPDPVFSSPVDQGARFLIACLFETKFYLLFSFLFGYSFTLQMQSAEKAGKSFLPRLLRRQAGLWIIGIVHAVLLFHGDILTTYAVLGVVLLMLRNQDEARILKLAKWLVIGTALLWIIMALLAASEPPSGNPDAIRANADAVALAYRSSPATVIGQHIEELSTIWMVIGLIQAPCALAMFLLGLAAGKRQVFLRFDDYKWLFRRLLAGGIAIGLPGAIFYGWCSVYLIGSIWDMAGLAVGILTAPFLTGAYIAGAMFLFQSVNGKSLSGLLAPAGRMALSNYLLQSAICATLFYAYGFGLIGMTAPMTGIFIALGIFGVQLILSTWWMSRFQYGPLEWLLRFVTIAARPRWRKQHP